MLFDVPGDERADRVERLAALAHRLEHPGGELAAEALTRELGIHLGVKEGGVPALVAVVRDPGDLVAYPELVAALLRVVDDPRLDAGSLSGARRRLAHVIASRHGPAEP